LNIEHRRVNAGRLELHVAEVGEGPAVLCLHGFPAYWADWQEQMLALAAAMLALTAAMLALAAGVAMEADGAGSPA